MDYKNQGLWIVPADDSVQAINLTEKFDFHVDAWTINDLGEPEMMPPTWSQDGQTLIFQVALHGSTFLKSISRNGENLEDIIGEDGVVSSFTFDQERAILVYL